MLSTVTPPSSVTVDGLHSEHVACAGERLEDAFASIGVAPGDDLALVELTARARVAPPSFAVSLRRAQNSIRMQSVYYARIEAARRELEATLPSHVGGR